MTTLNPTETATRPTRVIPSAEGTVLRAFGNEILFKLTAEETGGALSLGLATVPPGGAPPVHTHGRDDELFIIVDGQYEIYSDGDWHDAGPGAAVFLPRGSEHTFRVVGDKAGRHWVLTTPGGFDEFYARCAEVFAVPGPPDVARLASINADFGARIVGPAPTRNR